MYNMYGSFQGTMGYMPQQWGPPGSHPGMPMDDGAMADDMMDEDMPPFMSEFGDEVEFVDDFADMMGMGGDPGFYGPGPMPMGPMVGGFSGPAHMMGDDPMGDDPMFDDPTFMPTMDDHDMMGMEEPMMDDGAEFGVPPEAGGAPHSMPHMSGPMMGMPPQMMHPHGGGMPVRSLKTKKFTRNTKQDNNKGDQ